MRLLGTKSYELFEASDIPTPFPSYAILSHTWISSKDEITYQDMKTRQIDIKNDVYKQKGWSKLRKYCDRAAKDGWEWAWMDTCCIDKTNPADTQEAINAMFRWYQNAGICYAHLEDVDIRRDINDMYVPGNADPDETLGRGNTADPNSPLHAALGSFFVNSKWFTRGWTLQELLAPHYLVFVDRTWLRIGTRENWAAEVKEASNIEPRHLSSFNPTDFSSCSTAMRFSWASGRKTTIEEDETYSLFGLFGISLPLIYGEGRRQAFNRLQRQLIMVYNDDSLFVWKEKQRNSVRSQHRGPQGKPQPYSSKSGWGMLARSVEDFWDASKVKLLDHQTTFSMTNRGLQVTAKQWRHKGNSNFRVIQLDCGVESGSGDQDQEGTGIYIAYDASASAYHRIHLGELCDIGQINYKDWKEGHGREPILIRAYNYSDQLAYAPIFVLQYPEQIRIAGKYAVPFSDSVEDSRKNRIERLVDHSRTSGDSFETEQFSVGPGTVVFLTIELDDGGLKWELDVIINLKENCFPHVGILWRGKEGWERLGCPLRDDVSDTYNALAEHIYFTLPSDPTYPAAPVEKTNNLVVGTHLLPRPPRERSTNLSRESTAREYVLKISVDRLNQENDDPSMGQGFLEVQENSRKRQRIS